jgi:5-methylcytosine-specific restriction endonuclease McrA
MKIAATGNLHGRAVEEWIGTTPDAKIPARVRLRIFDRAGGICHITGRKIRAGEKWEAEHIKPLHAGGIHRESNLAPALVNAHREKTADERDEKAKVERVRKKHLGIFPKSKTPLRSRGFSKSREQQMDPDT